MPDYAQEEMPSTAANSAWVEVLIQSLSAMSIAVGTTIHEDAVHVLLSKTVTKVVTQVSGRVGESIGYGGLQQLVLDLRVLHAASGM